MLTPRDVFAAGAARREMALERVKERRGPYKEARADLVAAMGDRDGETRAMVDRFEHAAIALASAKGAAQR
jgi:hypothetical protein